MIKKSNAKKVMLKGMASAVKKTAQFNADNFLYVVALSAENAECSQKDA